MCLDSVEVVRMNLRSTVALTPLVESDAEIRERDSVRIQALGVGSQDADKLGHEIQNLALFTLPFPNRLDQLLLLSHIHPRAHESLKSPRLSRRNAHATDASNPSVRPQNSLREVECPMGRQHLLNLLLDEFPIFRMPQGQILFLRWRLASRIQSVNLKQLRRPILEPSRVEYPATCVSKPLSFREVELDLFAFINFEIHSDPEQQLSVRSPNRFGATEEPPVPSFGITHAETHLTAAAGTQTLRPDSTRRFAIVRMQKTKVAGPSLA